MPRERLSISVVKRDSAVGALRATAAGRALGAAHALTPPILGGDLFEMTSGGAYAPGGWTEATAMAFAIADLLPSEATSPSRSTAKTSRVAWKDWDPPEPAAARGFAGRCCTVGVIGMRCAAATVLSAGTLAGWMLHSLLALAERS